jgi:CRISPR/Cas system CSM-associated protein Csm4 (group 5 of RAMP superfamily)
MSVWNKDFPSCSVKPMIPKNNNLSSQFPDEEEELYEDYHIHKENRKSSNDRKEKKKIKKFSKYDY